LNGEAALFISTVNLDKARSLRLLLLLLLLCGRQVTEQLTAADVGRPPEDGIHVDGLWLEGARWDADARCLAASEPGVMCAPLPVVHFTPAANYTPPANEYACPLYKTSARAGVLSTTGCSTNFVLCVSLPVVGRQQQQQDGSSSSRPSGGGGGDAWVLQGVALLCQLDS
jgi:dynein heavy chain